MSVAAGVLAIIAVACMGFLTAAVAKLLGELLIRGMSATKPTPRPVGAIIRFVSWTCGYIGGGILTWYRFWDGMSGDGSSLKLPNAPSLELNTGAVVLGFVILWLASWVARGKPKAG